MTNKECISEYKRVMNQFEIPAQLQEKLVNKSATALGNEDKTVKNLKAIIAISGLAAVAVGIGAAKLFARD